MLLICGGSWAGYAQNTVNGFIQMHGQGEAATTLFIPGWLLKAGMNIAMNNDEELQAEMTTYKPLLKGLHGFRLLTVEEGKKLPTGTVARFVQKLKKRNYVPLVKVKSDGTAVNVLMRTVKRKKQTLVKKLLILVQEGNDLMVVVVNGRWNSNALQNLLKEEDILAHFASVD